MYFALQRNKKNVDDLDRDDIATFAWKNRPSAEYCLPFEQPGCLSS